MSFRPVRPGLILCLATCWSLGAVLAYAQETPDDSKPYIVPVAESEIEDESASESAASASGEAVGTEREMTADELRDADKALGTETDAERSEMTAPAESGLRKGLGPESRSRQIKGRNLLSAFLQETEQVIGRADTVQAAEIEINREEGIARPKTDGQKVHVQIQVQVVSGVDFLQESRGGNFVIQESINRTSVGGRVEQRTDSQIAPCTDAGLAQADG